MKCKSKTFLQSKWSCRPYSTVKNYFFLKLPAIHLLKFENNNKNQNQKKNMKNT